MKLLGTHIGSEMAGLGVVLIKDNINVITLKMWSPDMLGVTVSGLAVGQMLTARNVRIDQYNNSTTVSTWQKSVIEVNDTN